MSAKGKTCRWGRLTVTPETEVVPMTITPVTTSMATAMLPAMPPGVRLIEWRLKEPPW